MVCLHIATVGGVRPVVVRENIGSGWEWLTLGGVGERNDEDLRLKEEKWRLGGFS